MAPGRRHPALHQRAAPARRPRPGAQAVEASVYTPTAETRSQDKFRVSRVFVVPMAASCPPSSAQRGLRRRGSSPVLGRECSTPVRPVCSRLPLRWCAQWLCCVDHVAMNWLYHRPYIREWRPGINADHPRGRLWGGRCQGRRV